MTDGHGPDVRVALLTPSLKLGGLERMVHDMALALRARGFRAEVFVTQDLGTYAQSLHQARVRVWDSREPTLRIPGLPIRLLRNLADFKPAIIHGHSGTWFPSSVAKLVLRSPRLVFTDHGRYRPEPWYRALVDKWCFYRQTNRLVAVSSDLADYLADVLRLPAAPEVIENGIDLVPFREVDPRRRWALRAEWGVSDDEVLAVSVGRLEPVKNHAGLLQAVAQIAPQQPKLRLAIVGSGRQLKQLRAHVKQLGLEKRVLFLGYRSDIPDCLGAADVFVSASLTEGLPIALLEALAAGLPILTTAVGGIPKTLGSPPAGILVTPGDIGELATALAQLVCEPGLRGRLGARAREQSELFSLDACADRYCALYDGLLRNRSASR